MEQILLEVNLEAKTGPVQTRVSLPWNIKLQLKKKKERIANGAWLNSQKKVNHKITMLTQSAIRWVCLNNSRAYIFTCFK